MTGIEVEFPRSKAAREINVRTVTQESVTGVTASPSASESQVSGDGPGDGDGVRPGGDGPVTPGKPHQQAKGDGGDAGDGDLHPRSNGSAPPMDDPTLESLIATAEAEHEESEFVADAVSRHAGAP
jgi:hypothetical protein